MLKNAEKVKKSWSRNMLFYKCNEDNLLYYRAYNGLTQGMVNTLISDFHWQIFGIYGKKL